MKFVNVPVTDKLIKELAPALSFNPEAVQREDLNKMEFFRIEPEHEQDSEGFFGIRVLDRRWGNTLFITYLVGDLIYDNALAFQHKLDTLAKDLHCAHIEADVANFKLAEIMDLLNYKTISRKMVREVE